MATKLRNNGKYLANVLESIKFATIDVVAELNPVIVDTYKTNKRFLSDTIDEFKSMGDEEKSIDVKSLSKEIVKNAQEDLKTGKWYNKQRNEAAMMGALESTMGFDFDMFDEMDALNDDDAYEEGIESSSSSTNGDELFGGNDSPLIRAASKSIVTGLSAGIDYSNKNLAGALGNVMVETSKVNTKTLAAVSAQTMTGIANHNAIMHRDLTALNQNVASLVGFTNEAVRTHIENSTTFYESTTNLLQEQTTLLHEIVDLQKSIIPDKKDRKSELSISDIFTTEGGLDLGSYRDYIKQENKKKLDGGGGSLSMIKEMMPMIESLAKGSLTGEALKFGIKAAIPKTLKNVFTDVNDLAAGIMGTAIINLSQAKKGNNGAFFEKLGNLLGLDIPDLKKLDTSKYNKDSVIWTGKDHKALTVVIPKYLSDIYNAVSGGGDITRYDYETGKFVKAKDIKSRFEEERQMYVSTANMDINSEIAKQLNKIQFSNAEEKKQILDAIAKIQDYNFKEMKNFNPNSKVAKDLDPKTYGITGPNAENVMQIVKMLYTTIDKKVQMKGSTQLLENVSKYNAKLREKEASGDHLFTALFDDSLDESKIKNAPIMASANRLDKTNSILDAILAEIVGGTTSGSRIVETTHEQQVKMSGGSTTDDSSTKSSKNKYKNAKKKNRERLKNKSRNKKNNTNTNSFRIGDDVSSLEEMLMAEDGAVDEDAMDKMTYTQRIKNAERSSDKLKEFFKGFVLLTNKPITFLQGAICKVDEYAYSLFFGNGEEDVKSISGKIISGFDNVFKSITEKIGGVFTAITDEIKSEGKSTAKSIFSAVFGVDFDAFKADLKESLFGDEEKGFLSGFGSLFKQGFSEIFGDFFDPIKNIFKRDKDNVVGSAAKGMTVKKTGLVAVSAGERIIPNSMDPASISRRENAEKTAIGKFKNKFGLGSVDIDNYAIGGTVGGNQKKNKGYRDTMTYEEFNRFYQTLESEEEKNEYFIRFSKDYAKRMVKKVSSSATNGSEEIQDKVRTVTEQIKKKNPALADAIDRETRKLTESKFAQTARDTTKAAFTGAVNYGKSVKDTVKGGYDWIKESLDNDDEFTRAFKELMSKFAPNGTSEVIDDITQNWKKYIPKTLTGGALGAGVSLLTGLAGGPILGAAAGAALGFASKSTVIQKMIFGEDIVDDDGNIKERKDGVFKRELSDAIKKYAPDMVRSGLVGTAVSMLPIIPGSPMIGLMVGSALGYAKNNEEIMETLAGTKEKLANVKEEVKKKLPAMGLGALAGALTGPFGITTNLLLGSALGFASDTEKFKQMVFGYKGLDGKRAGGLVGVFKKLLAPPIEALGKLIDESKRFFKEEVFDPLKKAIKPMIQSIENVFNRLGDMIADSISSHITKPIGNWITDKFLVPIEKKLILPLLKMPLKAAKHGIRTMISPFVKVGRTLERSQLGKVGYGGGTAAERIARRQEYIDDYNQETEGIFDPLARIPVVGDILGNTVLTRTGRRKGRAKRWGQSMQETEAARMDEWLTNSEVTTEEIAKVRLLNSALGSTALNGKKGVTKYARTIIKDGHVEDYINNLMNKGKIPYEYHKTIFKELEQGKCDITLKLLKNNCPNLDVETRLELITIIEEVTKKIQEGIRIAENANEEAEAFERKYGFSIRGRAVGRVLAKELEAREVTGEDLDKMRNGINGRNPEDEPQVKYLHTIADDVSEIARSLRETIERRTGINSDEETGLLALPGPVTNTQLALPGPTQLALPRQNNEEDVSWQYTENGLVRLIRNDRGEIEEDTQDSETRETIGRRDENRNTQSGILNKLTGIGSNILDFFTGREDQQKPSIFSKILSMLGLGFSFLGGSKILTAAKWIIGGSLLSYGIGKLTKEDENGDSIASRIGNKFKETFSTLAEKVGGWWNDKFKPWFKEDFIPTAIDGLTTTIKGALGAGGWLIESLSTMLVDIAPNLMYAAGSALTSLLKGVLKGFFDTKDGYDDDPDESEIAGDDRGYLEGETKESINFQYSTDVQKNEVQKQYKSVQNNDGTTYQERDIESEIKNSYGYNNVKSVSRQNEIATNASIQEMWDQPTYVTDSNGNAYTLGELVNTPNVYIMDDKNGNPIYSQDILSREDVLKKVVYESGFETKLDGDYGQVSNEERGSNKGTVASEHGNVLNKTVDALIKNRLTGRKISTVLVNKATSARNAEGLVKAGFLSKFGTIGKAASIKQTSKNFATAIPTAAVNFDNAASAAWSESGDILTSLRAGASEASDSLPFSKTMKKLGEKASNFTNKGIEITKGLKNKAADKLMDIGKITKNTQAIEEGAEQLAATYSSSSKLGKILLKIKEVFDNIFSDSGLIKKIYTKLNKGVGAISKAKEITEDTIKKGLKNGVETLISKLPSLVGDKINDIYGKLVLAVGSGGATYIATAIEGFITGFKNADAYFEVGFGDVSIGERVISGLLGIVSEFTFGMLDPHLLISWGMSILNFFGVNMEDLEERQEELKTIVQQYNAENGTNFTPYDFVMDDKIETKIMKFAGKIIKGGWNIGKTILWDGAIKGIGNAVGSLFSDKYGMDNWKSGLSEQWNKTKDIITASNPSTKKFYKEYQEKASGVSTEAATTTSGLTTGLGTTNLYNENTIGTAYDSSTTSSQSLITASQNQLANSLAQVSGCTTEQLYNDEDTSENGEGYKTVNAFNESWSNLNTSFQPLLNIMNNKSTELSDMVSKNLAVSMGLADYSDDVTLEDILNDNTYATKRAKMIQNNSLMATISGGVTGSNSNNTTKQTSAANKKLYSTNNTNSNTKAVNKVKTNLLTSALGIGTIGIGGSGSGISNVKVQKDVNPAETNFVSQKYGQFANMTFGTGDVKQKVSDAGCAPAAAMMAVNSNIDKLSPLDMSEALRTAGKYAVNTGGVSADYFADQFASHGFKTAYVPRSDKNQKSILMKKLSNGQPVVLMGRDTSNTSKSNSPFGPTYHYVVATGITPDGKQIYINDPESSTPNLKYKINNILNKSDLGIVPYRTSSGKISKLSRSLKEKLRRLSGKASETPNIIFVGDSRTEGMKNALGENSSRKFIAKVGEGYNWLINTALINLKQAVKANPNHYIVFNLGVNDLGNIAKYKTKYAAVIKEYGSNKVFFMSVNPVDEAKCGTAYSVKNSSIHSFNAQYKAFAGDNYIDTCTQMEKDGFVTSDGVHYTHEQYNLIYKMVVDYFNGESVGSSSGSSVISDSSDGSSSGSSKKEIKTISDLISEIGSILSGAYGLSSEDDSSSESSDETTSSGSSSSISTSGISGNVSSDPEKAQIQKQLVAKMKSVEGQLAYSQQNRNPDDGSGDCSSTVRWAYKAITGKDIGSWTGEQETNTNTSFVDQPHMSRGFDESKLQLGDILLCGPSASEHVEMYYGDGKTIGHGGGATGTQKGPTINNITAWTKAWSAKRLNSLVGKGSGLFVSQNDSKYASKTIGDEKVSVAGCAPAVATMAINNSEKYNMNQAIKDAGKYKGENKGGVSVDYFIDVFKKQGYDTMVLKDKDQMLAMLAAGRSIVFIGRDASNKSKRNSPFGEGSHYVLATGLSSDKNYIMINDPEQKNEVQYETAKVMKGVQLGIIPIANKGNNSLSRLTEELRNTLGGVTGKGLGLPTSSNKILSACTTMTKKMRNDGTWTLGPNASSSYKSAIKTKNYITNGSAFVVWAMKEAGLYDENGIIFLPSSTSTSGWSWTEYTENTVKKNFELIIMNDKNKRASDLVRNGTIKAGDIVSYSDYAHANIYAGNNTWFDANNINCTTTNGKTTYKDWYGQQTNNSTVSSILRVNTLSGKNSAAAGLISSPLLSTVADSTSDTTSTVDSGSSSESTSSSTSTTFLNDLTEAFAKLAEGWGLASATSDDSESSDSSSSSSSSSGSTTITGSNDKEKIWNYFKAKGIPNKGIAGLMGNLQAESGNEFIRLEGDYDTARSISKDYTNKVDSGSISRNTFANSTFSSNGGSYGPGYGLAQWTYYTRKQGLYDLAKNNNASIGDGKTQLDWLWQELQGYPSVVSAMKEGSSIKTVSDRVMLDFERPADQSAAKQQERANLGQSIYNTYAGSGKGSGLSLAGIPSRAKSTIRSINRVNSGKDIPKPKTLSIYGKGTTTTSNTLRSNSSKPTVKYNPTVNNQVTTVTASSNMTSGTTESLLNAIITLLTQEVKNTAFIEGIANAIVSLVDAKAESTDNVSAKKQLLDTKGQILSLVQQQNKSSSNTSLNDLIRSMESIIAQ